MPDANRNLFDDIEDAVVGNFYQFEENTSQFYKIVSFWDQVHPRFEAHISLANGKFKEITNINLDSFLRHYKRVDPKDLPWRQGEESQLVETAETAKDHLKDQYGPEVIH